MKNEPILLLLKLLIQPVEGWKAIGRWQGTSEIMARRCFYPLTALCAACSFVPMFYGTGSQPTLEETLINAVGEFVCFFMGYYVILMLGRILLPYDVRATFEADRGRKMVMMSLCTLVLFQIITELLPWLDFILQFLPLYSVYLIMKGMRLIKPDKIDETRTMLVLVVLTICIPFLIRWGFDYICILSAATNNQGIQ